MGRASTFGIELATNNPLLILLAVAAMSMAQAQTPPVVRNVFEVASLKFHPGPITYSSDPAIQGNRVTGTASSVLDYVGNAYGMRREQIVGGPNWLRSDRYDLVAKAEGDAVITRDELKLMLQNLLASRFQFQFHRESREVPVYELRVRKDGPKFKAAAPDATGGMSVGAGDTGIHIDAKRSSMERLAAQLSHTAGRPVVDKTGLAGGYVYKLDFWPESSVFQPHGDIPSMFAAVQEQLGLKLEPGKGSIEVLVIDGAEKPAEN